MGYAFGRETLKISTLGQLLTLTAVRRHRAHTAAGDGAGGSPSRLTREEVIKQARGAFKNYSGPSLEEMKRLDLEEEIAAEEREYHGNPG